MSDTRPRKISPAGATSWRRWQMDELTATRIARPSPLKTSPESGQRESETLRRVREQAHKEAYQLGYQRGHRDACELGFWDGHDEGMARGKEQGLRDAKQILDQQIQETVAPLVRLVQSTSEALQLLDDEIAAELLELALAVGRQLARDALDAKPEQILEVVRELLHNDLVLSGKPRLWLHPDDLALVETQLGTEFEAANWTLQPDDQVTRGGCRITSPNGEVDASWEARCQAITQQLRKRCPKPQPVAGGLTGQSEGFPEHREGGES